MKIHENQLFSLREFFVGGVMFNKSDSKRDEFPLFGAQANRDYDRWHSFAAYHKEIGEANH
ncbi:MAG: hypothetical protein J6038_03950 [Bacilli bacterium]|nr:hypothetical protein [Bacilli bacterium]